MAKRIGPRMQEAADAVARHPGLTVHAYAQRRLVSFCDWRWSWVYAVFYRAIAAGLIETDSGTNGLCLYPDRTVYRTIQKPSSTDRQTNGDQ